MSLQRDEILGRCRDGKIWPLRIIKVPEWAEPGAEGLDRTINVRTIQAAEIPTLQVLLAGAKSEDADATVKMFARLVIFFACTETGERLFEDEDEGALCAGPIAPLRRIAEAGLDLNGFSDDAPDALAKN